MEDHAFVPDPVQVLRLVEPRHEHVVATTVGAVTGVQRLVEVGDQVHHETQRQRLVLAAGGGIAQGGGKTFERGCGIAFGRVDELVDRLAARQGDIVPGTRLFLPERVGVRPLLVRIGCRLGQAFMPENLLDLGARLPADIVLRYLRCNAVADRAPSRSGGSRQYGGQDDDGGDSAIHGTGLYCKGDARMTGEAAFVEGLRALARHPAARGLRDDAAVLEVGGETLVLTHDAMVEGRHYLPGQDMADVAWKLVATNLSDLAAKGAEPVGVLLGYMLGADDGRFTDGLAEVLEHYNVPLLGGDTVAGSGGRSFGLTAIGRATHTPVPSRAGAQMGDQVYVTGNIGGAMLGFEALRDLTGGDSTAYAQPAARLAEGRLLAPHVTAMMDVSDGLLLDAFRLAEASGASLAIDASLVPVADTGRRMDCMTWGDDYELLFTLPAGVTPPVSATRIGSVEPQGTAPLYLDGEAVLNPQGLGYQHG